jgi:AcrR family transcriptional regulator
MEVAGHLVWVLLRSAFNWSTPMVYKRNPNRLHPTKQKLLTSFLAMSADQDLADITVDALLNATGIAKGSLYYHFEDFDDLIAQAKAQLFSTGIDQSIKSMSAMFAETETAEDFRIHARNSILDALTPEGVRRRLTRASILSASMKCPKLQEYICIEQRRLTDEIAELLSSAQERGLVKKSLDTKIAAVFIQVHTFGKIVDDMSQEPVNANDWVDWIMSILDHKIFA